MWVRYCICNKNGWMIKTAKAINNLTTSWVKNYASATSEQIKDHVVPAIEALKSTKTSSEFDRLVEKMIEKGIFKDGTKLNHWERNNNDFGQKVFNNFTDNIHKRWKEAGTHNADGVKNILKSVVSTESPSWDTNQTNNQVNNISVDWITHSQLHNKRYRSDSNINVWEKTEEEVAIEIASDFKNIDSNTNLDITNIKKSDMKLKLDDIISDTDLLDKVIDEIEKSYNWNFKAEKLKK